MSRRQSWVVSPEHKNLSPYRFLCRVMDGLLPGVVKQLLREGRVTVNGETDGLTRPLKTGDVVEAAWSADLHDRARPRRTEHDVPILYRDDRILVVNKPAGLSVLHERRRQKKTVLDVLPAEIAVDPATGVRLKIVHRIDKHTSGALLLARDRDAMRFLIQEFAERRIHKEYLALVRGVVRPEEQVVDVPIGKDRRHALRMVIDEKHGKEAHTLVRVETRFDGYTLLRVEPTTGRTHQIRVHLAHIGFPILGDDLYGGRRRLFLSDLKPSYRPKRGHVEKPLLDRQALHCQALEFTTTAGRRQRVAAPLAADLDVLLKQLRRYRET